MRLIDADALKDALFQKHVHEGEELEPMLYLEDAVKVVENAHTIDAIPVEWLRQYAPEKWSTYMQAAVEIIIEAWQKEQEAQDVGTQATRD